MESETFRTRLVALMQKSRKAIRLYTTMGSMPDETNSEFREMQVQEWKGLNSELLKQLSVALENPSSKNLSSDVFALRDNFYSRWRMTESEMHVKQKELIHSSEKGDFIKSAVLSRELVALKARVQAAQAAHHEIEDVIQKSRVAMPPLELTREKIVAEETAPIRAKVIPLRKQV